MCPVCRAMVSRQQIFPNFALDGLIAKSNSSTRDLNAIAAGQLIALLEATCEDSTITASEIDVIVNLLGEKRRSLVSRRVVTFASAPVPTPQPQPRPAAPPAAQIPARSPAPVQPIPARSPAPLQPIPTWNPVPQPIPARSPVPVQQVYIPVVRPASPVDDADLRCNECDREFSSIRARYQHQDALGHRQSFDCDRCNAAFTSQSALRNHEATHRSPSPDIICDACDREFSSEQSLRQHQTAVGHRQRPTEFACIDCPRVFSSERALNQHQDALGHRPYYSCDRCEATFLSLYGLEDHEESEHRTFRCDDCDREFSSEQALYQHQNAVGHGASESDDDEEEQYGYDRYLFGYGDD